LPEGSPSARKREAAHIAVAGPRLACAWAVKGEAMPVNEKVTVCDFCHKKRVTWKIEAMAFRQWSDKGYVHCRVELQAGTCQSCAAKSLEPDSSQILDAAFLEEYRKLP
jgi:hypothetical protein